VNRDMPFAQLKSLSYINSRAQAIPLDDHFSQAIRQSLPTRPPFQQALE